MQKLAACEQEYESSTNDTNSVATKSDIDFSAYSRPSGFLLGVTGSCPASKSHDMRLKRRNGGAVEGFLVIQNLPHRWQEDVSRWGGGVARKSGVPLTRGSGRTVTTAGDEELRGKPEIKLVPSLLN